MIAVIDNLLIGKDLSTAQASKMFRRSFQLEQRDNDNMMQLLTLLQKKGETALELAALAKTVRRLELPVKLRKRLYHVDGCGTGGDGAGTFNISTLACIVAAGGGARVTKHGNQCVSSQCGSSDLMHALGVNLNASRANMLRATMAGRLGYFHAPRYHPLFKRLQPIRVALGRKRIRTIFNLAGPLVNPTRPKRQMIGVFRKDLARVIAYALQKIGSSFSIVFWNTSGLDELTTSHKAVLFLITNGKVKQRILNPRTLGLKRGPIKALKGGEPLRNRRIALDILQGRDQGPRRDVVLLNAAFLLYISGRARTVKQGLELARRSIASGSALNALKKLRVISRAS